ncbi:MAG: energy-coupling factor transporter ATPase [Clostridia bacterium]|nr:energy-coupling factor transporter ATPase [Clostridia bacterium]
MQIVVDHLSCVYSEKTPFEKRALDDVSFCIEAGQSVGIVGCTGSGKSTLIQHLNGLIKLKSGKVTVLDIDLSAKKPDYKALRRGIGMLFQYPEYQLFADTVAADVKFGPQNFGMSKEEAEEAAREAITLVGLDYDVIKERSPLDLSGGQKRRVAIAGVLAYRPKILILDEPTAGLDPAGKREMLTLIDSLKQSFVETVITVSHNMDEIAEFCQRVLVLGGGKLLYDTTPEELFYHHDVESLGLSLPHAVRVVKTLESRGFSIPHALTEKDLTQALLTHLGGKAHA